MKQRFVTAVAGLVVFFTVVYFFPAEATVAIFAILCSIATYEVLCANASLASNKVLVFLSCGFGAAVPVYAIYGGLYNVAGLAVAYTFLLLIIQLWKKQRYSVGQLFQAYMGTFVVTFLLSSVVKIFVLTESDGGYILLPFVVAWCTDIFAMQGGMRLGKHKLCPKISPKKTVEGAICGLLGGILGVTVVGLLLTANVLPLWALLLTGLFGSVVAQLGDLSMSLVKRKNGVKDFGNLFPGHGGVLDRFDSVMLAAPFVELVLRFMGIM